jgi:hypothetical protein
MVIAADGEIQVRILAQNITSSGHVLRQVHNSSTLLLWLLLSTTGLLIRRSATAMLRK